MTKLISIILLLGCSISYSQNFFNSENEYFSTVIKKTELDTSKFILDKRSTTDEFYDDIENKLYIFYGIAYKNKVYGANQLSTPGCRGQFLELTKNIKNNSPGIISFDINDKEYLSMLNLDSNKKTVIFLYTVSSPKSEYKKFFKPILKEIEEDSNFDYVVISLDYNRIISKRGI